MDQKKDRLLQMLTQMGPLEYNKDKLSRILYTATETGIVNEESPLENAETLFKIFILSNTITKIELEEIQL